MTVTKPIGIPSDIYSTDYLLSPALEGYDDYLAGRVSKVKSHELAVLDVRPGARVLDLGCGRGEVVAELCRRGAVVAGVDYSWDAAALSHDLNAGNALVMQADAVALPFADGSFDRVLMGDVIEHLPWSMAIDALHEVERVLAPGGKALVHTSPNTWFITFVLPVLRLVLRVLRRDEVLAKFDEYERLRPLMHPNEMNPISFRRLMRRSGVSARTWVDRDVLRSGSSGWTSELATSRLVRLVGGLAGLLPFRLVLGNDLYAEIAARRPRSSG